VPPTQHTGEPEAGAAAYVDLIVRVHLGRRELAGELITDGQPASTFTGWLGLLAALDQALDTLRPPGPETGAAQARPPEPGS
jgi:hypothetical protein